MKGLTILRLAQRAVVGVAAANLVIAGLGGASGILAARLLGVTGRGELAAVQLPGFILSGLAMLGMTDAMTHFARRTSADSASIIRTAFTLALLASLVGVVTFAPLLGVLLPSIGPRSLSLARWWILLPFISAFSGLPIMAFRALGHEGIWNILRVVPGVLWIGVLLGSSTQPRADRLSFVIYGQLLAFILMGCVAWLMLRVRARIMPGLSIVHASSLLRYGVPLALTGLPQTLNISADQLLLVRFVDTKELGYYVCGFSFAVVVSPVVSAFGIVLFPRLSSSEGALESRTLFLRLFRPAIGAAGALSLFAASGAGFFVPLLFGESFRPAVSPARVLAVAGAILALSVVLAGALQGLGLTKRILSSELAGLCVNALLLAVLVPLFGIMGAAIASLVAYSVTCGVRLRLVLSVTGTSWVELLRGPLVGSSN